MPARAFIWTKERKNNGVKVRFMFVTRERERER
jgi:hypothetical protein